MKINRFKHLSFCLTGVLVYGTGCANFSKQPSCLNIERAFARSTLKKDYLGARRIHRFTPILTDGIIYTANAIDSLSAVDRKNGQTRWRLDIPDGVEAGAQLVGGILYFGAGDGQVYAVQSGDGTIIWKYDLKSEGLAKPLVAGGVVYVLGGNNVAHALEARTGKMLWVYNRREASNLSVRGGAEPALYGDLALFGFSDGALVALNQKSGVVVWETNLNRNKRFRDVDATPIVDQRTVYVSSYDGALYALNAADGRIIWTVEQGGYEPVLLQGDILYYSSSAGETMAIEKQSGKIRWRQTNPHGIATTPVLYKGALVVGEMDGELRFLDSRSGRFLTSFAPGRGVTSRAATDPRHNQIMFMSADANLFALNVTWASAAREWPWE